MSMPMRMEAAASAAIWARAPAPSVTFTASASPFSGAALLRRSCASADTGGAISAVMTNRPARTRSSNVLRPGLAWSFIVTSRWGALGRESAYMLCWRTAIAPFLDRNRLSR